MLHIYNILNVHFNHHMHRCVPQATYGAKKANSNYEYSMRNDADVHHIDKHILIQIARHFCCRLAHLYTLYSEHHLNHCVPEASYGARKAAL